MGQYLQKIITSVRYNRNLDVKNIHIDSWLNMSGVSLLPTNSD